MGDDGRKLVDGLLEAYRHGFFPMAEPAQRGRPGPIRWFNPDPRTVLPLGRSADGTPGFHVSRSLRRVVRQGRFRITTDRCFADVMRGCAEPRPDEPHSWIDDRMVAAYTLLHMAGHAHSVEAWVGSDDNGEPGTLVGGLYGVHVGGAFFAESKFSRPARGGTNASKVCLVHLVQHLRRRGFTLLDVQFTNPHLEQFGTVEVPRDQYLEMLTRATSADVTWAPFEPGATAADL